MLHMPITSCACMSQLCQYIYNYANNVIHIMLIMLSAQLKKKKVNTLFNNSNYVYHHKQFTMEAPGNDGSIFFLDTKCSPNSNQTIISLFTENQITLIITWTGTLNTQFQPEKATFHAITNRAKMFVPLLKSWLKKWTISVEFFLKQLPGLDDQRS